MICPSCSADSFEVRANRDEGIALLHCLGCTRDYLLLDSEDYWFDVIQTGYPRVLKCSCKSTAFNVTCEYAYRDDGDVRSVRTLMACSSCQKPRRLMDVDIDYGGTSSLVRKPLRYCKNPKILYDLREYSMYVTPDDVALVIRRLAVDHHCSLAAQVRDQNRWVWNAISPDQIEDLVAESEWGARPVKYLCIYACIGALGVRDLKLGTAKDEKSFWRRHEVIRISSPTHMHLGKNRGLLYYLSYSNEVVKNERAVPKSSAFVSVTRKLNEWLESEFVTWRGNRSYDNPNEHRRLFGETFVEKLEK